MDLVLIFPHISAELLICAASVEIISPVTFPLILLVLEVILPKISALSTKVTSFKENIFPFRLSSSTTELDEIKLSSTLIIVV
jgi:hypothetical protein